MIHLLQVTQDDLILQHITHPLLASAGVFLIVIMLCVIIDAAWKYFKPNGRGPLW